MGGGGAPRRSPPPKRAPRPDGERGLDSPPGSAAHGRDYGSCRAVAQPASGTRSRTSSAYATRRARRPAIAAFVTGGSARSASSRSESDGCRRRRWAASWSVAPRSSSSPESRSDPHGLELREGRAALADEVRVIRVRQPIGVGPEPRDERPLLECEDGLGRAGDRQVRLDAVPALRIRRRVRLAVEHAHADSRGGRDASDEGCARVKGRPHLEVRRPGAAERPRAEEGAAQVGRAAARPGDDVPRRTVERQALPAHDPGLGQHVDRVLRAGDEQLRARGAVEGAAPVRPDLRLDPKRPEDREGTARDRRLGEVEVERHRAAAEEVDGAAGVEERRDLGQPVAAPRRRDRGELGARIGGERVDAHRSVPSSASSRRLRR